MLIRGAHLHKISQKDRDLLKEKYRLSTVIDLRTKKEMEEKPDKKIDGGEYIHIPIIPESVVGISHEKKSKKYGCITINATFGRFVLQYSSE